MKKFTRKPLSPELAARLPDAVNEVFWKFHSASWDIWLVGGGVRNLLMNQEIGDLDFTTNATPEEIQKLFPETFYDNKFGTVGVPITNESGIPSTALRAGRNQESGDVEIYEITTYRTEQGYTDRRRPDTVAWGKTLEEDLQRRDFTINAMAVGLPRNQESGIRNQDDIQGGLRFVDPFGGQEDLKNKTVKAVGEPEKRFQEDALRMMRAIRIGGQLGFRIEEKTLAAVKKHAQLLDHISRERVRDELVKILGSAYPADGILLLYNSGLLEYIMPEMLPMRNVKQIGHHIYDVWTHSVEALRACPSPDPIVRLATLLHDVGKPPTAKPRDGKEVTFYGHEVVGARMVKGIAERLRFSKKDTEKLWTLVRWHMFAYEPHMTDASIRRFIKRVSVANINDMMMLRVGDRVGGGSKSTSWRLRELQERIGQQLYEPMTVKDLKVDEHDVMEVLKIKPGSMIGKILNQLFEEVMEDTSLNDRSYLLGRIQVLYSEFKTDNSAHGK